MTKYDAFLNALLGFNPTNRIFALALFDFFYKHQDSQHSHFIPESVTPHGLGMRDDHSQQVMALRRLSFAELGEKSPDFDDLYADARTELLNKGFFTEHPTYVGRLIPTSMTDKIVPTVGEFARKYMLIQDVKARGKATDAELAAFKSEAESLATEKRASLLNGTIGSGSTFFHTNAGRNGFLVMRRLDDDYKDYRRSFNTLQGV